MRTEDFFNTVAHGDLSNLDLHNHVQSLTDNYNEDKVNLLCKDFDEFISMRFEEWHGSFSDKQIDKRIAKWHDDGKELPVRSDKTPKDKLVFISDYFVKTRFGKEVSDEVYQEGIKELFGADYISDNNVIDINVLLGGFYFSLSNIYLKSLKELLVELKRNHTSSTYRFDDEPKDVKVNNENINWLESNKSLEQFINALKEHNLIEARETEAIINNHFKPHREQHGKPKPIIWLESVALWAYMIESLAPSYPEDRQCYIKPENIWSDTAPHFSVNGKTPENLKQTANRFKQNKSGKPKHHEIIDNIIQSLSD